MQQQRQIVEYESSSTSIPSGEASLTLGKVIRGLPGQNWQLEIGVEIVEAKVAFGCLVRPVAGDRVLAARAAADVYILSVLERLMPGSAIVSLPTGGPIVIEGENIRLQAQREASIDAPKLDIRSSRIQIVAEIFGLLGKCSQWIADTLRVCARTQETVADTISHKALDRIVNVERADVLRAGSVSQTIENVSVTTAPAVVIAASADLRLDGERVTVG